MKLSFYLNNDNYKNIDFSNPQLGNPGIGGAEYMISLIAFYLTDYFDIFVFANYIDNLSNKTVNIKVNNFEDAIEKADSLNMDYLVCRVFGNTDCYKLIKDHKTKVIIWACNFSTFNELNLINSCKNVIKYVCVSKHQFDLLYGHPIYKKSTYIVNCLPTDVFEKSKDNYDKEICYVGSIIKDKGFAECCRVWRNLYDNGYRTIFNVVGSAKLYDYSKKLGPYGLATEKYEKQFIDYLTDSNGVLLPEVHLYGVCDQEKKVNIINQSYLGISASYEETFGLIAIEFSLLGKPFVAMTTCGYKDTVKDGKTGFLVDKENELYEACVKLLTLDKNEYDILSHNCVEFGKKFDVKLIIADWIRLFKGLENSKDLLNRRTNASFIKKIINLYNLSKNVHK